MSANPTRPASDPELHDETKAILDERLRTLEVDSKNAGDAREAVSEIRAKLKHPAPR
jgi:hypothetical protein